MNDLFSSREKLGRSNFFIFFQTIYPSRCTLLLFIVRARVLSRSATFFLPFDATFVAVCVLN